MRAPLANKGEENSGNFAALIPVLSRWGTLARSTEGKDEMSVTETIVGTIGELMLLLTAAFLVVAVAAALLAMDGDAKEYLAIGTPFVVAAGAMYTARGYLENHQWKKLSITTLILAVALMMSAVGAADVTGATVWETLLGSIAVLLVATVVTLIVYVLRIAHLCNMYCRKRTIVKMVRAGNYSEAVNVAEGSQSMVAVTNYVKSPENLSYSAALALSCALAQIHRQDDAWGLVTEGMRKCSRLRG